jgi:hypothetical protein
MKIEKYYRNIYNELVKIVPSEYLSSLKQIIANESHIDIKREYTEEDLEEILKENNTREALYSFSYIEDRIKTKKIIPIKVKKIEKEEDKSIFFKVKNFGIKND